MVEDLRRGPCPATAGEVEGRALWKLGVYGQLEAKRLCLKLGEALLRRRLWLIMFAAWERCRDIGCS